MMLGLSLAVIVAVVLGLVVWSASDHGSGGPSSASDGDVDRTVGVLREKDPVCDEWGKYADELAEKEERWAGLNKGIPAAKWTPEQREIFESVGRAMSTAANRFESILPDARNVVLKELIAQTIVYLRAYAGRIPSYVASDGLIAGVAGNFGGAVTYMCSGVSTVPPISGDEEVTRSAVPQPAALTPFMVEVDSRCPEFQALVERQSAQLGGWMSGDATKSAYQWTANEHAINNAAREVLERDYGTLITLGKRPGNPIMSDLISTQAGYVAAFADALTSYTPDDSQLWDTVVLLGGGLTAACRAQL